jgi:hypothetical protein
MFQASFVVLLLARLSSATYNKLPGPTDEVATNNKNRLYPCKTEKDALL